MAKEPQNRFKVVLAGLVCTMLALPMTASSQAKGEAGDLWDGFKLMLAKTLTVFENPAATKATEKPPAAKPLADAPIPRSKTTLPLLDGSKTRTTEQPQDELTLPSIPNARELFELVISCWPEKSFFRAELSLEGRATRSQSSSSNTTSFDPVTGSYTSSNNNNYIALVGKIPLYSGVELDREREREAQRRTVVSNAVGTYITALAEYKLNERQIKLLQALEKRSQERVAAGIAETREQVNAFENVAQLENKNLKNTADLIRSRLTLSAMCDDKRAWIIDGYLKKFTELN